MNKLMKYEQSQMTQKHPEFNSGDTVNVHYRVIEGNKERIQQYTGVVISVRGSLNNKTFMVRKISGNVGVERIFPYYSPFIAKIVVVRRGKVRRAKTYYQRQRTGKAARIKEKASK